MPILDQSRNLSALSDEEFRQHLDLCLNDPNQQTTYLRREYIQKRVEKINPRHSDNGISDEIKKEYEQLLRENFIQELEHYIVPLIDNGDTFFVFDLNNADMIASELKLPRGRSTRGYDNNKLHVAIDDSSFNNLSRGYDCIFNFINRYNLNCAQNNTPLITRFKFIRPSDVKHYWTAGQVGKFATIWVEDLSAEQTLAFARSLSSYLTQQELSAGPLASSHKNRMDRDDIALGTQFVSYSERGSHSKELKKLVENGNTPELILRSDKEFLSKAHEEFHQIMKGKDRGNAVCDASVSTNNNSQASNDYYLNYFNHPKFYSYNNFFNNINDDREEDAPSGPSSPRPTSPDI